MCPHASASDSLRACTSVCPPPISLMLRTSFVCLFVRWFAGTEYTDSQIVCLVGPGVGTGFHFYITGWIAPPQTVGYAPPSITSLSPSLLPVTGGVITLTGSGFGVSPCGSPPLQSAVLLRLTSPPTASQLANATAAMQADSGMAADAGGTGLTVTSVKCDIISWSNTTVECVVPAGLDPVVPVTVAIGNQAVSLSHAALGFVPPTVFDADTPVEPSTAGWYSLDNRWMAFVLGMSCPALDELRSDGCGVRGVVQAGTHKCSSMRQASPWMHLGRCWSRSEASPAGTLSVTHRSSCPARCPVATVALHPLCCTHRCKCPMPT